MLKFTTEILILCGLLTLTFFTLHLSDFPVLAWS